MADEHGRADARSWTTGSARRARRLRPEVAAEMAARSRAGRLEELYRKPVTQLSPADLSLMKAAFLRG